MNSDLAASEKLALATSELTWNPTRGEEPPIPEELRIPRTLNPWIRLVAWRNRHRIRRIRAEEVYLAGRNPKRGLPVAGAAAVKKFLQELLSKRKKSIVLLILFNALAGLAGLVVPKILGSVIDVAQADLGRLANQLSTVLLVCALVVIVQALLNFAGRRISTVFGQSVLAEAREKIIREVLKLPLSKVENASTGDLVTRVTRDVQSMAIAVRWALPQLIVAGSTFGLTIVGMFVNSWLLSLPLVICITIFSLGVWDYLRHATAGYTSEGAAYSLVNSTLTESIEGARTVESLQLGTQRINALDNDLQVTGQAERYTASLRNILFVVMDFSLTLPTILVILAGFWGYQQGLVTLGEITTATVYTQMLNGPLSLITFTLDHILMGVASTTRLLGIAQVPSDRQPKNVTAVGTKIVAKDLRFAYHDGIDVINGIDLELEPGERLAIVGPSGSGKSTLGRLLAGINRPRTGKVTVGGVDVMDVPIEQLRQQVALVTQEHHVFVGTLRDNIILAREDTATDEQVWEALTAVEASEWVRRLPEQLDTQVGSGNLTLTPGQAQQVALARLVIANPHTLVLDEATSLIDPHTARELEGSMAKLMLGRTVVAIAHRLHTAHDADRIAVVIDGKIVELGCHDELLKLGGEYAKLWQVWSS